MVVFFVKITRYRRRDPTSDDVTYPNFPITERQIRDIYSLANTSQLTVIKPGNVMSDQVNSQSNADTTPRDTFSPIRMDLIDRLTRTCERLAGGQAHIERAKLKIAA